MPGSLGSALANASSKRRGGYNSLSSVIGKLSTRLPVAL